jgi:hypothetical protein
MLSTSSNGDAITKPGLGNDNTALEDGPIITDTAGPEQNSFTVNWDGPSDAANPVNWPENKRWANISMISALGLITYAISTHLLRVSE